MYEITRVDVPDVRDVDINMVNEEWLSQGWEPFSVTLDTRFTKGRGKSLTTIWLRREKAVASTLKVV